MLKPFADELWIADGPVVPFLRVFPYPTRMAVVRLPNHELWVWSPIALETQLAREVEALGTVRHLVAPNKLHHLFLPEWRARFPEARLYGAPGLAAKRPDLAFDAELGDAPDPSWQDAFEQCVVRGSAFMDEVVFLHRASRTALVCDLVQRMDPSQARGPRGWLLRMWGLVGEDGGTPREWRASFRKRDAARAALEQMRGWRAERLVIAHGMCAEADADRVLGRALGWMA
jgi:hypothetical protein